MSRENRAAAPDWTADDAELNEVLGDEGSESRPAPGTAEAPPAGAGEAGGEAGGDGAGTSAAQQAQGGAGHGGGDGGGPTGEAGGDQEGTGDGGLAAGAPDDEMDAFFPSVARAAATGLDVGELLDAKLLTTALAERDEYLEALRRLQADFENFRKRTDRQLAEVRSRASEALLERLLPVLDACDLALAHLFVDEAAAPAAAPGAGFAEAAGEGGEGGEGGDEDAAGGAGNGAIAGNSAAPGNGNGNGNGAAKALSQVASLLWDTLAKEGLERIDAVGVPFDPTVHDAVAHAPAGPDDEGDGAVVEQVLRAGYLLKGRVLRPAMVQVRG